MYLGGVRVSLTAIFVFNFVIFAVSDALRVYNRHSRDAELPKANAIAIIEEKCQEYATARYQNVTTPGVLKGDRPFIVRELDCVQEIPHKSGVYPVEEKEYPHVALLGTGEKLENVEWFASGSLISDQFILSAASHQLKASWAALGLLNKSSMTADKLNKNIFKITKMFTREEYKTHSAYNDIALYKLEKSVLFTPSIRPICLYTSGEIPQFLQHQATVAGWGQTDSDDADTLRKGRIDFIESKQCTEKFANDSRLERGFLEESIVCAGNLIADDITCVAQNGGSLQIPIQFRPCMWSQVGITAYGSDTCGDDHPTLYTKVSYHLPWIQSIVWP